MLLLNQNRFHAVHSLSCPESYIYYDRKTRSLRNSDGIKLKIWEIPIDFPLFIDYYDWKDYFTQKWYYEFGWILFNSKNVEKLKRLDEDNQSR